MTSLPNSDSHSAKQGTTPVAPPWTSLRFGVACPFFESPLPGLGFSPEELERPGFWESRLHPEDRGCIQAALESSPSDLELLTFEYRVLALDGTWHWLRDRIPRPGPEDSLRLPGCILDITRERDAQARLELYYRMSEILGHASDLLTAAPDLLRELGLAGDWDWAGLWMVDKDPERIALKSAWMRPGRELASFETKSRGLTFQRGQHLLGGFWSEGRVKWVECLPDPTTYPRGFEAEKCGFRSACCFPLIVDGVVRGVFEFFGSQSRTTQPPFVESLHVVESQIGSFTQRMESEDSLRRSEAQFRALFDQAPEGVFLVDLETKRILEGNRALQEMLGYTPEELRRLRLYDLVAAETESIDLNAALALQRGYISIGERPYRRMDGSILHLYVTVRSIDVDRGYLACVILQDFSAQKQLEAEKVRLIELLEATPDFVGMANERGEITFGNAAMRKLRGLDSPEARRPIMEAHPEWAAKILMTQALPTAAEEGSWRGETALLNLEGQEIPVSQVIVAHRDETGQAKHFSTIARDIREQKRVESNLWSILKNLHDLQFAVDESLEYSVTDANGLILEANRRFCELSGYTRNELLGKNHRILKSGYHGRAVYQEMWETIKRGEVWRGEVCNRTKGGTLYWVDATIIPWMGPNGEPERYMALRKVITERKLAEAQAHRREEQLKVLLQISRDLNRDLDVKVVLRKVVMAALDLTGAQIGIVGMTDHGKVRFTECHRGGAWVPLEAEFLIGEGVPGLVMASGRPHRSTESGGEGPSVEMGPGELDFSRGAWVPILDWEGRNLGCLGIQGAPREKPFTEDDEALLMGLGQAAAVALVNAREILQRELHQREMEHTQRLQSLGIQAGGIAHDFNNLLSAIAGNVSLAQLHAEDGSASDYLEKVSATIQRAADLTHQLLAYAGKGRSGSRVINLNTLVAGMVRLLGVSISKKARLQMNLASDPLGILADPGEIQQVVMNLVINASDALEGAEGDIYVSSRMERVDQSVPRLDVAGQPIPMGTYVILEVRDTGCGMSEEVRARIFDPFFTTKSSGRGLGLSAILGIIRHHGATLQVESTPRKGTTFTLWLTPTEVPGPIQEEARSAPLWTSRGRILLADDEAEVRSFMASLLTLFGFEVVEAQNGEEALARYAEGPPFRLLLTDLTMPALDGLELARRVRKLDPGANIIVCTGFSTELGPATLSEVSAVLHKPFTVVELNGLLKRVLEPDS